MADSIGGAELSRRTLLQAAAAIPALTEGAASPAAPPSARAWWPSRWGPDDQLGALNLIGRDQVRAAAIRIASGETIDLGRPFKRGLADYHGRGYSLVSAGAPSGGPVGKGRYVYNEEFIAGTITGMSTHLNALAHLGQQLGRPGDLNGIRYYNGFTHAEIGTPSGFRKLGMDHVPPLFLPGVLLDIAGLRARPLERGEQIGVGALRAALERQGMTEQDILPGSALFWHVGSGDLWKSDPKRYASGCAGLSQDAADWLADRDVAVIGADAVSPEASPNPEGQQGDITASLAMRRGIYFVVNLQLDALANKKAWRFAFSCAPVIFEGAQGAAVRPFAII